MAKSKKKDINRDRDDMTGQQEYLGEDIGELGQGKGADRKRLANEIDDNAYDEDVVLKVVDDPKMWGRDLQVNFTEDGGEVSKRVLTKYVKIIKKTYHWVRDDSTMGQKMTSIVAVRSAISMTKKVWDTAEEESEEFAYYVSLIKDIIGGRIHDLGIHSGKGQIFKLFSLKNLLPDEFADKREVTRNDNIKLIEIIGGSKKIKEARSKSKKRLEK